MLQVSVASSTDISIDMPRQHSLPEIVSEPHCDVIRVRPHSLTADEAVASGDVKTQRRISASSLASATTFMTSDKTAASAANVETQFRETLRENTRLAQELGAAKHEIALLKGRLRELEVGKITSFPYCSKNIFS